MTFGTDMIESVPRSVMLHITFRGDEVAMNTAIACGDLVVQHVAGKEMVGYSKVQVGRTKQTADEGTMKGGSMEMTALGFEAMSGFWRRLEVLGHWDSSSPEKNSKAGPLAITDKGKEEKAKEAKWVGLGEECLLESVLDSFWRVYTGQCIGEFIGQSIEVWKECEGQ